MRKIIHIDMDAFYAAIEQRDHPQYRNHPLIVGGAPNTRSVVAAASYEARAYGIHSAMPSHQAHKLCPHAIFIPPRIAYYKTISQQIRQLFHPITPLIEPLSLDEAYLDVTHYSQTHHISATQIAQQLLEKIYQTTQLTASAGVSYNKMLAKIACEQNKPNGLTILTPKKAQPFLDQLPIEQFPGIGQATAKILHRLGIHNGIHLRQANPHDLQQHLGKRALQLQQNAHGHDPRPVLSHRSHQSIGREQTLSYNLTEPHHLYQILIQQNQQAHNDLIAHNLQARTLTLKIKYADFQQITRSKTLTTPFIHPTDAHHWIKILLAPLLISPLKPIRLIGISYSTLSAPNLQPQLPLFPS